MNKWIILVATIFMALGFSTTIGTTVLNPSTSNVVISAALAIMIVIGLFAFYKADNKKKKPVKQYNGYEPSAD